MKIMISYFAKISKLSNDVVPIAICAKPPIGYKGINYKALAPSYSILMEYKNNPDIVRYTNRFNNEIMNKLDIRQVINDLESISGGKDVALICFEKSSDFCHRRIVAQYIANFTGIPVEEFDAPEYTVFPSKLS